MAIIAHATLAAFLSYISTSSFGGGHIEQIMTMTKYMEYITIAFISCSIFAILRVIIKPYVECANQGSGQIRGNNLPLFENHEDYMNAIKSKDGRINLILNEMTRATLVETVSFFEVMTHYNSAIWLMWGILCWLFTGQLIILICFCIAAIIQIEMYRPIGNLVEQIITKTS